MEKNADLRIGKVKIKKRYIIASFIGIILVGVIYLYITSIMFQSTDDAYIESHLVQISPKVSGQVVDVFVDDNQKVNEGDTVIKIDDTDYKVRLAQAEANYQKAILKGTKIFLKKVLFPSKH